MSQLKSHLIDFQQLTGRNSKFNRKLDDNQIEVIFENSVVSEGGQVGPYYSYKPMKVTIRSSKPIYGFDMTGSLSRDSFIDGWNLGAPSAFPNDRSKWSLDGNRCGINPVYGDSATSLGFLKWSYLAGVREITFNVRHGAASQNDRDSRVFLDKFFIKTRVEPLKPNNEPHVSFSGSHVKYVGQPVTPEMTIYDLDNDHLTIKWRLQVPEGSKAGLTDTTVEQPTFTPDIEGQYISTVTVSDGKSSVSKTINWAVKQLNRAPIAHIADAATIKRGETVVLDGSGSFDADDDEITYQWKVASAPKGAHDTLDNVNHVNALFRPNVAGEFVISLVVNDGELDSAPVTVTYQVEENQAPVAEIAHVDGELLVGTEYLVDGSESSDADGDELSFKWTLITPEGSSATLSNDSSATPSLVPDVAGLYYVTLVVNDGALDSEQAETFLQAITPIDHADHTYVAQANDTLVSIAQQLYGDEARWTEIQAANNNIEQDAVKADMELIIPGPLSRPTVEGE